ncbi:hypothetical protein BGZ82_007470 [Podila clonocystis]|nr:hypothetical protein BGZ82_007470 [Podila clonocystis]
MPQEAPQSDATEAAPSRSRPTTSDVKTLMNHRTSPAGSPALAPSPLISTEAEHSRIKEQYQQQQQAERYLAQRMLKKRAKRLEKMLGEFYLKMPENSEDEEAGDNEDKVD